MAVAVLARQLTPADFGLVALAQVVLLFIAASGDSGVGTFTIYDREIGWENRVNSTFWFGCTITVVQLVGFAVLMPIVSHFYNVPRLSSVLAVLTVVFVFRQLASVPEALNRREFRYKAIVLRDTFFEIMSATLSVVLALKHFGVWSIILPQLIVEPLRTASIFSTARWRPTADFGTRDWRRIGGYSTHLMGTNYLALVANDGDTLLIGKLLGSAPLGLYSLAWQLSNMVGRNLTGIVSNIAMPAFSSLGEDVKRLRSAYTRMLRLLASLTFPALAGMFVLAEDLVMFIYGPRWFAVALLLRILIIFTIIRSVTSPCAIIFNVMGRPDLGWKFAASMLPFYLGSIALGSRWGIVGVAVGVSTIRFIAALCSLGISARLINMPFRNCIGVMAPSAASTMVMGVSVWLFREAFVTVGFPLHLRIVGCVVVGGLVYVALLRLIDQPAYSEITGALKSVAAYRKKGNTSADKDSAAIRLTQSASPRLRPGTILREVVAAPFLKKYLRNRHYIVDVGGYDGAIASRLKARGCNVSVVDLDVAGLTKAHSRGLSPVCASAVELPIGDGAVDGVLCLDVLSSVPVGMEDSVVLEMARVLRDDGFLIYSDLDADFRLPFVHVANMHNSWGSRPALGREEFLASANRAGLELVEEQRYYGALARLSYAVLFFHNVPKRGGRSKRWFWRNLVTFDGFLSLRPKARLIVLRRVCPSAK